MRESVWRQRPHPQPHSLSLLPWAFSEPTQLYRYGLPKGRATEKPSSKGSRRVLVIPRPHWKAPAKSQREYKEALTVARGKKHTSTHPDASPGLTLTSYVYSASEFSLGLSVFICQVGINHPSHAVFVRAAGSACMNFCLRRSSPEAEAEPETGIWIHVVY